MFGRLCLTLHLICAFATAADAGEPVYFEPFGQSELRLNVLPIKVETSGLSKVQIDHGAIAKTLALAVEKPATKTVPRYRHETGVHLPKFSPQYRDPRGDWVLLTASWCGPCRGLKRDLFKTHYHVDDDGISQPFSVSQAAGRLYQVVDVDKEPSLAAAAGFNAATCKLPMLVLRRGDGAILETHTGQDECWRALTKAYGLPGYVPFNGRVYAGTKRVPVPKAKPPVGGFTVGSLPVRSQVVTLRQLLGSTGSISQSWQRSDAQRELSMGDGVAIRVPRDLKVAYSLEGTKLVAKFSGERPAVVMQKPVPVAVEIFQITATDTKAVVGLSWCPDLEFSVTD